MLAEDHAVMWLQPIFNGVSFIHARFIRHAFPRHSHDYFAIGVIEEGTQQFAVGRQRHTTPQGGIFIVNPGEVHTGEAATRAGFTYRTCYPTADMLRLVMGEITGRGDSFPEFTTPVIQDPDLTRVFLDMHHTLELAVSPLEAESRLRGALTQLVLRHAPTRPSQCPLGDERREVARTRAYLEAHYAENVTLEHLAMIANLSPYYLHRVFRKQVGMPPYAYLENLRIHHAQRLIAAGHPLVEIAFMTGFTSQSHFTTSFKRYLGVTPGYYARLSNHAQ
jgi:AraC-like DNA-binding protein